MLESLLSGEADLDAYAGWLDIIEQMQISGYINNALQFGTREQLATLLTHLLCENTVWKRMVDYGLDSGNLFYSDDIVFIEELED